MEGPTQVGTEEPPPSTGGMFSTLTRMLRTLGDVAENRVELFVVEWREERLRLLDALLLLLAGTVCALMTLVTVTLAIVVVFWNTHRMLVLGLVILAYASAAAWLLWTLRSRLCRWQAFTETLEQIKKDRACFKTKS